eukprot:5454744-Pleurochrysis_carterae.AAC.3
MAEQRARETESRAVSTEQSQTRSTGADSKIKSLLVSKIKQTVAEQTAKGNACGADNKTKAGETNNNAERGKIERGRKWRDRTPKN